MKYLSRYPRLLSLLFIYILTIFIFSFLNPYLQKGIFSLGSFGVLIFGALYTYSFTGSVGTGAFILASNSYSPVFLAIVGGIGAGLADVSILRVLKKFGFTKELDKLSKEKALGKISKNNFFSSKFVNTLLGLLVIASPLPDEIGIIFVERGKLISEKHLFVVGVITNAIGIYILTSLV